jgi:hypothetical protein
LECRFDRRLLSLEASSPTCDNKPSPTCDNTQLTCRPSV